MSANATLAGAIAASAVTQAGLYTLVQSIMHFVERRRERKEDAALREGEAREQADARRRAKEVEDSRIWYQESRENYAVAKREASQARTECAECAAELRSTRQVIYRLLEDLEEHIIPIADDAVRAATRAAVHRAREAL